MTDILERLKNSSKINGAYPKDIEDAIKEIEEVRRMLKEYYKYVQNNTSDRQYDEDGWLADLDSDAHLYLWNCGLLRKEDASAR